MKTYLSILLLFVAISVMAQDPIEVKIEQRPSSLGIQPAFEMVVPQATEKEAINLWEETIISKNFLKKSEKMEKVNDEWWVNNLVISEISSMPLNVITQISSFPGQIYVRIFLQSQGEFIGARDSVGQSSQAAIKFIRNYGVELYRLAVGKELKMEERNLEALENDLKSLKRKNNTYDEKIEDIQEEQDALENETEYNKRLLEGSNSSEVIGDVKPDELSDEIKTAEKDLKKAEKAEKKFENKVSKNEQEQNDKIYEIEKQREVVLQVKTKLNNIR